MEKKLIAMKYCTVGAAFAWQQNICGAAGLPLYGAAVHLLSWVSAIMINDAEHDATL